MRIPIVRSLLSVHLAGGSAGAIGALFNVDYLASQLPGAAVKAAPLSGWFFPAALAGDELLLFQEWESVDALQGHFETDHMEEFLQVLPDVLDGEVATRRYEVKVSGEGVEGVETPEFEPDLLPQPERQPKIVH